MLAFPDNHYISFFGWIKSTPLFSAYFVTVFTAQKARQLLKEGFTIADIKADKTDVDHKRSIFIFRNEEGLLDRLKNLG